MSKEDGARRVQLESLGGLSEEHLRKLYSIGEVQRFSAGVVALGEGDTDSSVYIILEGRAEVSIPRKKGWFTLATLMPGSIFGELAFFDRMPRSARVSAVEDCSVLRISEGSFRQLMVQDAGTAMAFVLEMARIVSLRLRGMNELVRTLLK